MTTLFDMTRMPLPGIVSASSCLVLFTAMRTWIRSDWLDVKESWVDWVGTEVSS